MQEILNGALFGPLSRVNFVEPPLGRALIKDALERYLVKLIINLNPVETISLQLERNFNITLLAR